MVRSSIDPAKKLPKEPGGTDADRNESTLGEALRQVYDRAVAETIPDEMLDLLSRLD